MTDLQTEIKALIIETLNLEDMTVEDIRTDEALFVEGLGLDSIDALELGVALKKKYNLTLDSSDQATHEHFASVKALAEFVQANQ